MALKVSLKHGKLKVMPESSPLASNLINTIYMTFDHNKIVIGYFLALLLATILVFKKPNRFHLLLLFGFAILTFNYEYEKHIIAPLREQTLQAVAPNPNLNIRAQRYIDVFLAVVTPIGLFITGWGLIFWAMIIGGNNGKKNSTV